MRPRAAVTTVPHPQNYKSGWDVGDAILSGFKLEDFISASESVKSLHIELTPGKKTNLRDRLITTQELLDRAPDYVEFLVHDLITANELQVLAAPPRAGKL